jgi:O-antigen ligase
VLIALALVPAAQAAAGIIYFAGDAWMASLFLVGLALTICIGASAHKAFASELSDAIFGAFLIAAILSVGMALYQWMRIDDLDFWIIDLPLGGRPYANIGQPNHLATMIGLGLVGLWWLFVTRRVSGMVSLLCAAYLLFGLAMTQSRTAWVFVPMLIAASFLFGRSLQPQRYRPWLIGLGATYAFFVVSWGSINRALSFDLQFGMQERLNPGTRLHHWHEMVSAIAERPFFGWGWNQVSVAQQAVALKFAPANELIDHSHNLILDLLVWNGLLVGLPIAILGVLWLVAMARRVNTPQGVLTLLALLVFFTHALLEFPHTYAYLLLPCGLLIGILCNLHAPVRRFEVSRPVAAAVCVALMGTFVWTAIEYYEAKNNLQVLRFESARLGTSRNSKAPDLVVLTQLRAFLTMNRIKPGETISFEQLELMRKVVQRYPEHLFMLRYAMAAASLGKVDAAEDTLARLCRIQAEGVCKTDMAAWRLLASTTYPRMRPVTLPTP